MPWIVSDYSMQEVLHLHLASGGEDGEVDVCQLRKVVCFCISVEQSQ